MHACIRGQQANSLQPSPSARKILQVDRFLPWDGVCVCFASCVLCDIWPSSFVTVSCAAVEKFVYPTIRVGCCLSRGKKTEQQEPCLFDSDTRMTHDDTYMQERRHR